MKKIAQESIFEAIPGAGLLSDPTLVPADVNHAEEKDEEVVLELTDDDGKQETIVFTLPAVPGADDDSEIVVDEGEGEIEVEEPEEVEIDDDPWNWQSGGHGGFLGWLSNMMMGCPRHSGRDTTGLEKAISYFEALDREITKAMRTDYRNEIDSAQAEEARAQIEDGLQRLVARLEKVRSSKFKRHNKKKRADVDVSGGMVKEAGTTRIDGIVISVPLFISSIARTLINGHVSAGHDIEQMFDKLKKKYKLSDREELELVRLLFDMGFPVRRDFGLIGEDFDPTSSDNFDAPATYQS